MKEQSNATNQTRKPIGRIRALIEAVIVLISLLPAIVAIAIYGPRFGLSSPAFPPLGIYISLIIATVFLWLSRERWREIGFFIPRNPAFHILAGLGTAVVAFFLYDALVTVMEAAGAPALNLTVLFSAIEGNLVVYLQFMILVVWGSAGIGEEMFARGFLLHRFERVFRGAPFALFLAVLAQAISFGLLHGYQGPIGIAASGMIGLMMGGLYLAMGRNLLAPIIAHGAIDSYAITMIYLGKSPLPGIFG